MKLGPSICAKTQLSWGSDGRVITSLLQITQDRSFNLFWVHTAICSRLSSRRLQNQRWSSRSTGLNTNSRPFQLQSLCLLITRVSTHTSQSDFHTVKSGWSVGKGGKAWPSSFSYPHTSLPSGIQGLESEWPTFSPQPFCSPWFPSAI